jgi:diketogulonate reductase-like aldo/keto reductase
LLHWRGDVPLEETVDGFQDLIRQRKIRHWGVSNFDVSDLEELVTVEGGSEVSTDQVLYNLTRRGIEYDLLPWCRAHKLPVMAYSPVEQGRMLSNPVLKSIATRHGATPAQVALVWLLRQEGLIAIPKAGDMTHVRQNRDSLDLTLDRQDLEAIDNEFPPPSGPSPLEMI